MPLPARSCGGDHLSRRRRIHDAATSARTRSTTAASTWRCGARPAAGTCARCRSSPPSPSTTATRRRSARSGSSASATRSRRTEIAPAHVIVHAAYVLNTATRGRGEVGPRARAGLAKELERSTALGVGARVLPSGRRHRRRPRGGRAAWSRAIIQALEAVTGRDPDPGREHRRRRAHDRRDGRGGRRDSRAVPKRAARAHGLRARHLPPLRGGLRHHRVARRRSTAMLDAFEDATGEPPGFFHLNDSEGALGSNKDRHMLIGDGADRREPFRLAAHGPRAARAIPLILETPQQTTRSARTTPRRTRTTCG